MRIFTGLLLIATIFLGGMLYGSYEKDIHQLKEVEEKGQVENEVMQMKPYETEQMEMEPERPVNMAEDVPFVHKIATFGEQIFLSIYDYSLRFIYYFTNLFY